jgi:hypothetical protein
MAEMIISGDANAVSIEHGGREVYNKALGRWETETLVFTGLAAVDRGACETCMIRRNETVIPEVIPDSIRSDASQNVAETVLEIENKESEEMDKVEFDKALAELKSDFDTRLKAIEGTFSDAKAKSEKEMSDKADAMAKQLSAYEDRIKMLETETVKQKSLGAADESQLRKKLDFDVLPKK